MLPKMYSEATAAQNPELVEDTRAMMLACQPAAIAAALDAMATRPDSRELLETISVPTLVLVGEVDPISSAAEMREIADAIHDARYVVVPGASHLAPLESPGVVNEAIRDFLRTLTDAG
jgi:pimeloyl-ACP methyl ester carboxylesterase